MVTVSHLVHKLLDQRVFIQEALREGIVSYGSLAYRLQPELEAELGKSIKPHAIAMAVRRYAETLQKTHKTINFDYSSDLILKTDLCDISVARSPTLFQRIQKLYDIVHFDKGDILNIIHGSAEVSIVTNERYKTKLLAFLGKEHVLNVEDTLVSLTLTFSPDFFNTPGIIFNIVRNIAWENINIYEIVSTNSELTLILAKTDAVTAYKALEKLMPPPTKIPPQHKI